MALAEQTVILTITYDDTEASPPETWAWHELIDCLPEDVKVVNVGEVIALEGAGT